MNCLGLLLAGAATITGLVAAWLWFKASKIIISPGWTIEPGEEQLSQMGWTSGIMEAVSKSSELNKSAALWTACSVLFGAAYNFLPILLAAQ